MCNIIAARRDGTTRDVTAGATYVSNEAAIVSVNEKGEVTAGPLPGETAIMARYMNHICVANVVIPQQKKVEASFYASLPRANFIDELVYAKLGKLAIMPSPPAAEYPVPVRRPLSRTAPSTATTQRAGGG